MEKPAFQLGGKPTRTASTERSYLKGGLVLLTRAQKGMTGPGDVIEAFRTLFADTSLVFRPSTTRVYERQTKAVIARELSKGELTLERAREGFAQLRVLLRARRGRCPKRTSRRKLKSGTYSEFRAVVRDFADRAGLEGGLDRTDTVLAMLVKVGPHLGLRPCEWMHASIAGETLTVVNAKSGNGRGLGELRTITLGGVPRKIITLVTHLIRQIRLLFAEVGSNWRKMLGRLGERLARVCARIGTRRWSLYTTRHLAIANWKRAGLSDAEIASLAGHSSTRTARQHYAAGRHGWTADLACARPDPALVANVIARRALTRAPSSATNAIISEAPAQPAASADVSGGTALPAAIPRVQLLDKRYVSLPVVPSMASPLASAPSDIGVSEPDGGPAFGMG